MAQKYDIRIDQGADKMLTFALEDEDGNALDLGGYTARMQVRPRVECGKALDELTTENDRITIDGGSVKAVFPHEITEAYPLKAPFAECRYDLEIVSGGGQVTRVVEGRFLIIPNVTR